MKGRDNYLCRYRFAEFEREPLIEARDERASSRPVAWSRRTETETGAEVAELPDELRLWRDVNARADTCTGTKCPEYEACWLTR
jgi:ATP-dependent DNA helicase DinG